jgi:hypothetical protein
MLTLARIDKINIAIRCTAFSNLYAVSVNKQVLRGNCTRMTRKPVAQEASPGRRNDLSRRMGEPDTSRHRI